MNGFRPKMSSLFGDPYLAVQDLFTGGSVYPPTGRISGSRAVVATPSKPIRASVNDGFVRITVNVLMIQSNE